MKGGCRDCSWERSREEREVRGLVGVDKLSRGARDAGQLTPFFALDL
jgi:hypothetical protein